MAAGTALCSAEEEGDAPRRLVRRSPMSWTPTPTPMSWTPTPTDPHEMRPRPRPASNVQGHLSKQRHRRRPQSHRLRGKSALVPDDELLQHPLQVGMVANHPHVRQVGAPLGEFYSLDSFPNKDRAIAIPLKKPH